MSSNFEKYRVIEKVRVSYLRNRGDLFAVLEETGMPRDFVEKQIEKFKRESKHDIKRFISDSILEHLLFNYKGRVQHLMDTIKKLEKTEYKRISVCCNGTVRKMADDDLGNEQWECLICNNLCDILERLDEDTISTKMSVLDLLRKEDAEFIKFTEKLGLTNKKDDMPTTVINNQNNYVVMPNGKEMTEDDIKKLETLKPIEQESLRLNIEKSLLDAEIVDNDENK